MNKKIIALFVILFVIIAIQEGFFIPFYFPIFIKMC